MKMTPDFTDFEQWIRWGWEQGWVSPIVCNSHDGVPMSEAEEEEWEEGDPCIHVVRLYESDFHKKQVERNCPPAVWRASNAGWKA